jgi:hypothetical protein
MGLLEVPATYLGSFGYFLARGPVLLNGCSSEKLMLMGGGGGTEGTTCLTGFPSSPPPHKLYNLLSLVPYPNCVHFSSLTLSQLSIGGSDGTCP